MKYVYMILFLSVGTPFFVAADSHFSALLRDYNQNKRDLSKISGEKAELEKKIEEINKKLSEIAAELKIPREELDSVPDNRTEE